jgi:hypothetical protein
MKKGTLYSLPFPSMNDRHYFVIASKAVDNYVLLMYFSSVKKNDDGSEKYHDKACELSERDQIKDKYGKLIIRRKSYVRYQKAIEIHVEKMKHKIDSREYEHVGEVSPEILDRIISGAAISKELEPYYKKIYF